MSEVVRNLLRDRFEPRRQIARAVVSSAPLVNGRSTGYVVATVAGQAGVRVRCDPYQQPPLAPGDAVDVQAYGSPSATFYQVLNRTSGARADSGSFEFTQETTYNGTTYNPGDQLLGSTLTGMANWWYVYDAGHWQIRSGTDLRGAIGDLNTIYGYDAQMFGLAFGNPEGDWLAIDELNGIRMMNSEAMLAQWAGSEITLGQTDHPRLHLAPSTIEFLAADGTVQAAFDGETRTIYGFDRWGQPLGPALEIGPTTEGRYGLWLRGWNNVPFVSLISGDDSNPDDVQMRIGPAGSTSYLEWKDDTLTVVGNITILNPDGGTVEWDDIANKPTVLGTPGAAGLYLTSTYLGYWDGAAWDAYIDNSGNMALGSKLTWDGTTLTISGSVTATTGKIGNWNINATSLYTGTEDHSGYTTNAGDITLYSNGSDASIHAKNFYIDTTGNLTCQSATISGAITATSGTFSGLVQVGTGDPHIHIDGTNSLIESSNFVSGTSGWRVESDGSAEFENIVARGAIKTAVFQKSLITAFAGSQMVSKSASTVATNVTLAGTTFTLVVQQQAGGAPFASGDLVYLKTEMLATYATVNAGSASGDNWSYTATYKSGSSAGTVPIGSTVVDYGPDGDGRLMLTADQTNAPYLSIATHNMSATPVWTERARLGNLTGISGASGYGLWTDNGYFTGTVNFGGGNGVLNSTGLAYTDDTNTYFKVDSTATDLVRLYNKDGTFTNGMGIDVEDCSYGLRINNTAPKSRIGTGGLQISVSYVGDQEGEILNAPYGVYASVSRGAGSTYAGIMAGYYASIASAVTGDMLYGFYSSVSATGSGQHAFTFYGTGATIHNTHGATLNAGLNDSDTIIAGNTVDKLLVVDAGLDAVQIGTTTAGVIADFRSTSIVLNEDGADRDFRVESDTEANALVVDAGTDSVWLGGTTNGVKVTKGGALSFEGTAKLSGTTTIWISGAEGVAPNTSLGVTQRLYEAKGSWAATGTGATGAYNFPFPVPYQWFGLSVVVTSITIYYRTVDTAYIDSVYLYAADLDATLTAAITHTDNLGEAEGDGSHDIVDSNYTMTDYPHYLQVDYAGADAAEDVRIYGFKVTWEVT
jgi:hypothetical protein